MADPLLAVLSAARTGRTLPPSDMAALAAEIDRLRARLTELECGSDDTDRIAATATDALHAYVEHEGDWRDGVCACEDDVNTVLKAVKLDQRLAEIDRLTDRVAELERERDQARTLAEIHRTERDAEAAANKQLAADRDQALARVAELEREQAIVDAGFEQASTIAERDHPDAHRHAWELIAGVLAGPGQSTQPATGGVSADG